MHILILSDGFAGPAYKPRLRVLCDYLHAQGHIVEVYCEQADPLHFKHAYPITEIALYSGSRWDWALKNLATMLFEWKERVFMRRVEKAIEGKAFDLVFCTSFYSFPLRAATHIAHHRHIPCVVDLRDMVEQAPANQRLYLKHHSFLLLPFTHLYRHLNIRRRNRELQRADAITTVSPWHVELVRSATDTPCHLIYNGYDEELFVPKDTPSDTFRIIYTGKVFPAPQQDPTLLFAALKRLPYSPNQLSVDWYCDAQSLARLQALAEQHAVQPWMHYHPMVTQQEIIPLLHQASICLVLTAKAGDRSGHGIMTTKFFEALGTEKPVLCVESDEECLAQVIRETNAGLSATNTDQVVQFIQDKYTEWEKQGFTRQKVNLQRKQTFSRQVQAQQWQRIFKDNVQSNLQAMTTRLHIICFDIPYPPSYGGAIDVYYRVKCLSEAGVRITLHCFYKGEKGDTAPLEKLCERVFYYPRKTTILQQLSCQPYGVKSRESKQLLQHLLTDDAPVLFEGLVSCGLMSHPALQNRKKYFRECNVEHDYYHALGKATSALWKKLYLHIEAERLRKFEHTIRNAQAVFTLAKQDDSYFRATYPETETVYLPCFHGHTAIIPPLENAQPYILYHGNLAVAENEKAAMYIMRHIAPSVKHPIVIAGNRPSAEIQRETKRHPNVTLVCSPDEQGMQTLIRNARIHLLVTFQATGIKLKLLNVLFTRAHVIVNPKMIEGTELQNLCCIGTGDEELIQLCNDCFSRPLDQKALDERIKQLNESYSDFKSAQIIYHTIFKQ